MSDAQGTIASLFDVLGGILLRLAGRLTPETAPAFFAEVGIPLSTAQAATLAGSLDAVAGGLTQLANIRVDLNGSVIAGDAGAVAAKTISALSQLASVLQSIPQLANAIGGLGLPGVTPDVISQLPARIFNYLVVDYFSRSFALNEVLEFSGFLERVDINVNSVDPAAPFYTLNTFHFDKLTGWLTNPPGQLRALYDWGAPGFDGTKLLSMLDRLAAQLGLPVLFDQSGPQPTLDLVDIVIKPNAAPNGLLIRLDTSTAKGSAEQTGAGWTLTAAAEFDLPAGTEFVVQPNGTITATAPNALSTSGQASLAFSRKPDDGPITIFAIPGASRVEAQEFTASAALPLKWTGSSADGSFGIGGKIRGGKVVIDTSQGDGFLAKILSGVHVESNFDLGFNYSGSEGLHFEGSGALEIQLPIHISLGPVDLNTLTLSIGVQGAGFPVAVSTNLKASLGPLQAVVEGLGFKIAVALVNNNSGNLGPIDLQPGFKPPNGVGLSIDAGVVKGGGFLYIDTDHGRYAGALQLVMFDFLNVSAIGLIDTKMPDGSEGFALLVIITADFGPGIQLGFGFTLLAVGGLLGLNRAMLFQPIMDGVRTNAIANIMFPQDVIANAPRIISDLQAFFPPHEGTFLIGPMAKLGWGEPTLVSLSLGVIIEIPPGDIAILGILKLALPAEEIGILVLQVNFAGALEFDKQRLYFFAALFDSHILFITIDGGMGLLFAYGDDANFVVSIGGFHPQFNPPPLPFPIPQRIQINIINESFARIHCEGYFAITTNTVQFGAHSNYFFGFSALSVEGASGFDALIQFSPFHFIVEISTSFSVHVFGAGVFGIDIDLSLSGPTPFHAHGTASLSFFFFSIGIGIDFTWGDSRDTALPPVAVMPILINEFGKRSNWRAFLPTGATPLVSLRQLDPTQATFVLHPLGTLRISQREVPLDLTLDKFGNQRPTDANRFALSVTTAALTKTRDLQEPFAPAQFKNMSDALKLSQPAYVPQDSGIELAVGGTTYASGAAITRIVRYDVTIIDTKLRRSFLRFFVLAGALFNHFLRGSSAARCSLSAMRNAQTHPYAGSVTVEPETFAVALKSNNSVFRSDASSFTSQAAANDYVARTVASDPALAGTLHVVPQFEMAA
jgi:hypothetical protein